MTERVCPYLRTFDDANRYVSRADEANGCYSSSSERPSYIPLDFQDRNCLGSDFARCARYRSAGRTPAGRRERQLLIISAGLGGLLLIATCVFLGIMLLSLSSVGSTGGGLLARATETPTATPSPLATRVVFATATATPMPTLMLPTATLTPSPLPTRVQSPTPTWTPDSSFVSPIGTPTPLATARPRPTTPWRPPATSTPYPTSTGTRTTPTNTAGTPTATLTRTATPLPQASCRADDVMTIIPTVPAIRQVFTIEVKSAAAYVDVSLVVSGSNPRYNGVKRCGNYYCWRWEDSWDIGGTYTYSFKIKSGAATCVSKAVTVTAPTDTPTVTPSPTITPSPTPSPTPTPFYDFQVLLNGNPNGYIAPGGEQTFDVNLTNLGNREDVYNVWLQLDEPPPGQIANWTVQYCVGDTCYDYTVPNASVTVPAGSTQLLHIKFRAADDAPLALVVKTTIKVQSQTNLGVIRGTSAQVTVIQQ